MTLQNVVNIILWIFISSLILAIIAVIIIVIGSLIFKYFIEGIPGVCRCNTVLHEKVVLVTGGNDGIGLATARDLAKRGAHVIIASRNMEKSAKAVKDIINATGNEKIECKHLDLTSFKSIRAFAREFNRSYDRLDILINNAGLVSIRDEITEDGFDKALQANYLGPFLLTNLLLEKLIQSKPSRIIIVSSCFHHLTLNVETIDDMKSSNILLNYSYSKLCDVLWTKALAKRLPKGVIVNAVHPGAIATTIFNGLPWIYCIIFTIALPLVSKTVEEGAQTIIHAAVSEKLKNVSGTYLKDCKPHTFNRKINNDNLVETVWRESLQMTKSRLPESLLNKNPFPVARH